MQVASFQHLTEHVTFGTTPRVWSLLVTVFGELAQDVDAQISGALLRNLCKHIGIKPEAMRVALHRLRKDGWIDSTRTGRTSDYFLTQWGRAQSIAASPRIYAKDAAVKEAWLVIFNPGFTPGHPAPTDHSSGVWVSSNMLVTCIPPNTDDVIAKKLNLASRLPEWITSKVCDPAIVKLSEDFLSALDAVQALLGATPNLTPMQTAALRILLVHSWRRIVLKTPVLPDHVFPVGWCGMECRARTFSLLGQLPKQTPFALAKDAASQPTC